MSPKRKNKTGGGGENDSRGAPCTFVVIFLLLFPFPIPSFSTLSSLKCQVPAGLKMRIFRAAHFTFPILFILIAENEDNVPPNRKEKTEGSGGNVSKGPCKTKVKRKGKARVGRAKPKSKRRDVQLRIPSDLVEKWKQSKGPNGEPPVQRKNDKYQYGVASAVEICNLSGADFRQVFNWVRRACKPEMWMQQLRQAGVGVNIIMNIFVNRA